MTKLRYIFLVALAISLEGFGQNTTNVGTDFWIAFPPNHNFMWDTLSLFISSEYPTSGSLISVYPGVNQSFTVIPGVVTQVTVPIGVSLSGGIENKGIEVLSADPISLYGLNKMPETTDAYLALPVNALGTYYRIESYLTSWNGDESGLSVVATEDATSVSIYNYQTDSTTNITLNQGQTYYMYQGSISEDITGSSVTSNFPVAVFGSNRCSFVPVGCSACDHIVEQMFPYFSWGKNFITVPLAGRDSIGDIFRIIAEEDSTDITINNSYITSINAGDHYEVFLTESSSINTSKAIQLAQYARGSEYSGNTGDPFMMLIPPEEQFLTNYTVINVTLASHTSYWINLVAPSNAIGTINLDGVPVPGFAFTQIGLTNFYGAQLSVTSGSHNLTGSYPFGVFVYGWADYDSYGYPGGASLSPVGTVNSVSLSPDTLYGQLNVTNVCFTAHVLDNLLNPVQGVLVNFYVTGINPLVGYGYTDALGEVQYCYTQTGVYPGEDNVYAEVFGINSDTSIVFWTYLCTDPTSGGAIGNDQSGCGSFTPMPLMNITLPSGHDGVLEYKWQQSVESGTSGFTDIAGSNSPGYAPGLLVQTTWFRRLARVTCKSDWSGAAESNMLEITVVPPLPVLVSITASGNSLCDGVSVMFTAQPINQGISPVYQWQVNGLAAGSNDTVFSYIPVNNDFVTCILTSSDTCTSGNPDTSNIIQMTVIAVVPVDISIAASSNPYCSGSVVTFTATPINGGTAPSYQWKLNSVNTGSNSPVYDYTPLPNDFVECILTSSDICVSGNPAGSNVITMTLNTNFPAVVSIAASSNPFCIGSSVSLTAAPVNGGSNPSYQWIRNSVNTGTNSPVFTCNPEDGDSIWCIMTSNLSCVSGNPATSSTIVMNGKLPSVVTFTQCYDTITTVNAQPFKLKGGVPLGGTYSGPGVDQITGYFNPAMAGVGLNTISYSYTNQYTCSNNATRAILVVNPAPFSCGDSLTDIRDLKKYPTIQIGSQCWLAANLNYGVQISGSQSQRDNCIVEKYCYNGIPELCALRSALYQWDELMHYEDTEEIQGLCPPGWHIPSEADWNQLFATYQGNAFAGSPLLYTGYSGFNVLLAGVEFFNQSHRFADFASIMWSSTSHGPYKAWSHGLNEYNYSVSYYPSYRSNAFSVRCVLD